MRFRQEHRGTGRERFATYVNSTDDEDDRLFEILVLDAEDEERRVGLGRVPGPTRDALAQANKLTHDAMREQGIECGQCEEWIREIA
jgi:hypothetical protein